jgi:hypothetical protein
MVSRNGRLENKPIFVAQVGVVWKRRINGIQRNRKYGLTSLPCSSRATERRHDTNVPSVGTQGKSPISSRHVHRCTWVLNLLRMLSIQFDHDGNLPLHLAAVSANLPMISLLGDSFPSGAGVRNEDGMLVGDSFDRAFMS